MPSEQNSWTSPKKGAGLKVFVPLVHAARAGGLARTLIRAGHTIWMNAPDSVALTAYDVAISEDHARSVWGTNVYCYTGTQILTDPPDVIIVGYEGLESSMFELHERLSKIKPIVICCLSGNYQSHFKWNAYCGSICSDEPSRALSRYNGVPTLRYYELFDPNSFPYKAWTPSSPLILPVLVKSIRQRFPFSAEFCDLCSQRMRDVFDDEVAIKIFDDAPLPDAWAAMEASPVVLAIKDQEGYGWAMLEALSMGRPIIFQAGLLRGMEFHKWTEPGVSGISFETPDDLVRIAADILEHPSAWQIRQQQTATILRERYDGEATADDLNAFLESLVWMEWLRWCPGRSVPGATSDPYRPSLDPSEVQEWERLTGAVLGKPVSGAIPVNEMGAHAFVEGWEVSQASAGSFGKTSLDLSHLPMRKGAMLCVRHYRGRPMNLSLCHENDEVFATVTLPPGISRVPIPPEIGFGRLHLIGDRWSPKEELGSADPRILSFELLGITFPGN